MVILRCILSVSCTSSWMHIHGTFIILRMKVHTFFVCALVFFLFFGFFLFGAFCMVSKIFIFIAHFLSNLLNCKDFFQLVLKASILKYAKTVYCVISCQLLYSDNYIAQNSIPERTRTSLAQLAMLVSTHTLELVSDAACHFKHQRFSSFRVLVLANLVFCDLFI